MLTQHGPRGWSTALMLAIAGIMGAHGYDKGRCYCAEDMDNELWDNRNSYVDIHKPSEYLGVLVNITGHYTDCTCTDVIRCKSPLRVTEASVVAKTSSEAQDQVLNALIDLKPYLEAWSALKHRVHRITVDLEALNSNSKTFTVEAFLLGDDNALVSELQVAIGNLTEDGLPQVGAIGGFSFTVEEVSVVTSWRVKRDAEDFNGSQVAEEVAEVTTRNPYLPPPTKPPQQNLDLEALHLPLSTTKCKTAPPEPPRHANYTIENDAVYYMCDKGYSWDAVSSDLFCDSGASGHGYKPCIHCTADGWHPDSLQGEFTCTLSVKKKIVGTFDWMYPNVYIVTAPAFFGLVLVILFCICCTRMNSPLYHMCRDKSKDGLIKK